MALYEFGCEKCGKRTDMQIPMDMLKTTVVKCPKCGTKMVRHYTPPAVQESESNPDSEFAKKARKHMLGDTYGKDWE
jgi:putative FmdB family regulatory protein